VQDRFNVTRKSVIYACEREGLPYPLPSRGADERVEKPAKTAPTNQPPRVADLIATGGRYADLRAWAARWGVTEVKARQEWHKLRLPVGKGASG
jgi:hypothetical protein